MDNFFITFPQYQTSELYISGESFAGIYIPYIASKMLERNKQNIAKYNLKSLAIGNGWMDPLRQYKSFLDFSTTHDLLHGSFLTYAQQQWTECQTLLQSRELIKYRTCESIPEQILDESRAGGKFCINIYDIRLRDTGPNQGCGMAWPNGISELTTYLSRDDVKKALHATGTPQRSWVECQSDPRTALENDQSLPSYRLLPGILESIPVTLFIGEYDLICNWMGIDAMVEGLTWAGAQGMQNATVMPWLIDEQPVGSFRTARNLSFVMIYNASHMPAYDSPKAALDMLNRVIRIDHAQPLFKSKLGGSDDGSSTKPETSDESPQPVIDGSMPPPSSSYAVAV
eukprot:jgi/Hompol1/1283/HPOL_001160-RA